jgi:molybdopterin converting factor small subunit
MKVAVRIGAPLSQVIGESRAVLTMPPGATAADALDELRARYPDFEARLHGKELSAPLDREVYSLFVNARPVSFEQAPNIALRDGDRIFLFLPVAGG